MSENPDVKSCVCRETGDALQAPYCSLHYHFGMLLGVGDLETEQAYHRGKMWLHSSWLHREGVIWGFGVESNPEPGEIRVLPGLAIDALGREIHLDGDACLNVAAWFDDRRKKYPEETDWFTEDPASGAIRFDAHVVIRFKACLTRQVPSLAEPCESAGTSTAYSRLCETVEILLRPRLWPDPFDPDDTSPPKPRPYRRLRLLYGLETPTRDGGAIVEDDLAVLQSPRNAESFRRFAALDEIDLRPPEGDEFPVLLANIHGIQLTPSGNTRVLTVDHVDVEVRSAHVATAALQEIVADGTPGTGTSAVVVPESVVVDDVANQITFESTGDLAEASVTSAGFALTGFDPAAGWSVIAIDTVTLAADRRTVTLGFSGGIPATVGLVRLVIHGTGSTPLLDTNLVPFNHGHDFTYDHRRS